MPSQYLQSRFTCQLTKTRHFHWLPQLVAVTAGQAHHCNTVRHLHTNASTHCPSTTSGHDQSTNTEAVQPIVLPVRSFFVAANGIDVATLLEHLPPRWQPLPGRHSALLTLKAEDRNVPDNDLKTVRSEDSYVSVFKHGAMVFVNCDFATYLEAFNLVKRYNASTTKPEYGESKLS